MTSTTRQNSPPESINDVAAQWVLRRDRGLTAAEQDELSQWLAADPRHGEALALHRWGWDELDRVTGLQTALSPVPDPDLLAPRARLARGRRLGWIAPAALAAAAALMLAVYRADPARPPADTSAPSAPRPISTALAAPCERRQLEDGSTVELNRGGVVRVLFTATARRVRVEHGEANFVVTHDPARPFIVDAAGCEVIAVGTEFNVRIDHSGIEVLVTEGKVNISAAAAAGGALHRDPTPLGAGQCAIVPRIPAATPRVAALTRAEIAARLAWQPRLLDFTDTPLAEIVAAFNRRNPVQVVVADAELAALKLSATFRSDNVEGFVQLMESAFGMRAEWRNEREIALRNAKQVTGSLR